MSNRSAKHRDPPTLATTANANSSAHETGTVPLERELTSFVGRERELSELSSLCESSAALVTIHGPAGVGKTRLAQQLLAKRHALGEATFFCDLRDADTLRELCEEVARTLGVQLSDDAAGDLPKQIAQALAALEPSTLVLDNYEQLVSIVEPSTLTRWLECARKARLVVTSRRRLRLQGERTYALDPLPVTGPRDGSPCDAVRLFVDRAESTEPALRGALHSDEHVHPIVSLLDGMPLAIELAAGLMRRASPAEALESLQRSQLSLCARHTNVDRRHVSLRTAIQASWDKLTPTEREAAAALSIFRGGFTIDGAAAVLASCVDPNSLDAFEAIDGLSDASILRVVPGHSPKRWDFFEATHEYAAEQLDLDSSDGSRGHALRARHATFMAEDGQRWLSALASENGLLSRASLRAERANLQAAFEWTVASGDRQLLPRIARAYDAVIRDVAPRRSIEVLGKALDERRAGSGTLRAELLTARAASQRTLGRLQQAHEDLTQAEALAGGEKPLEASIMLERGRVHLTEGNCEKAREALERALRLTETATSPSLEGSVHSWLAALHAEFLHDPAAFQHYRHAIERLEEAHDEVQMVATRGAWGFHRLLARQPVVIEEFERQLEIAKRFDDRREEVRATLGLALLDFDEDNPTAALDQLENATRVARASGLRYAVACCRMFRGILFDASGDRVQAAFHYSQALESARSIGSLHVEAMTGLYYSAIVAKRQTVHEGRALLARSAALLEQIGDRSGPLLCALQKCRLDFVEAAALRRRGFPKRSAALTRRAIRDAESWQRGEDAPDVLRVSSCYHAVLVDRMVRRDLEATETVQPLLRVWNDGSTFQIGERSAVSVGRGPVIRRVLAALREERVARPGASLTVEALLSVGWPDQSMLPASGVERIKTVVKRLRRAGLKDILRTEDGGYLLDPAVPVEDVQARAG